MAGQHEVDVHIEPIKRADPAPAGGFPRVDRAEGPGQRITVAERWDYTVAELRGIAAEHGLPTPSRMTHGELVELIAAAGVPLPPKQPERRKVTR